MSIRFVSYQSYQTRNPSCPKEDNAPPKAAIIQEEITVQTKYNVNTEETIDLRLFIQL